MLQKFAERVDFWLANLLTSTLFLAVHLPGWLALHMLRAETAVIRKIALGADRHPQHGRFPLDRDLSPVN